ncbi:MAG TPA: UDP-N-acetylmuramoyl-tripeptide--D-alanyl-D-alanine ligase [Patescibacteria group bacterium]|nr:UDP-N-acetylmuramoyl-tripeptide--D-alanyl-D-alanine ligase [Patescibacteria group bacterium]
MAGLLFGITSVLFSVSIIASCISWVSIWQDKEYSLKRLIVYLKETKTGREALIGRESLIRWLLIFLYSITIFFDNADDFYHYLVFAFYLFISAKVIKKILSKDFSFPTLSFPTVFIIGLALIVEFFLYLFAPVDRFLWLLVLEKLLPIFIVMFIGIFYVFYDFSTDIIINKALERIEKKPNLLTIAIAGSYGRGSTKEFISNVLSLKFDVLATNTTFSNSLGIAKSIITGLTAKKQIFIAEMDDYNISDMEEMANIISPKIAVIGGINEQKLSMFGSVDAILESKKELINALSRDGIAIFNGNSEYAMRLYEETKQKKFIYFVDDGSGRKGDITATNIKESRYGLSFDVELLGRKYKLASVKLLGRHNIENLLPAIFIGVYVGLDFSSIRRAIDKIKPLGGAMDPRRMTNGPTVIDDTHNANINSISRALSYMSLYKGKKVLVLEPLVELGKFAEDDHYKLGLEIGRVCDRLFLTNNNYSASIIKGIKKSEGKCKYEVAPTSAIINFVRGKLGKPDVVVLEGKQAHNVLTSLKTTNIY